jgi:DNA polymerase elongation subunit (family B)
MYEVICDSRTEMDYKNQNAGRHNHLSECDIDFRTRWLQRAYQDLDDIRFSVKDINICYLDIEVATKGKFPSADKALYPINCITIYFSKYDKYYTYGLNQPLKEETVRELAEYNCEYINCPTERDLLHDLFVKISENEADILTGWNSDFFDIPYIVKRAETMEVPLRLLSRLPDQYKTAYISKQDNSLVIAGTEVVDFLKLYRKFNFSERDNYKLDTIGAIEVGERKAPPRVSPSSLVSTIPSIPNSLCVSGLIILYLQFGKGMPIISFLFSIPSGDRQQAPAHSVRPYPHLKSVLEP